MTGITDYLGDYIPEDIMGDMPFSPAVMFWLMLAQGIIAGPTINAVAAFGGELGWRGFLLMVGMLFYEISGYEEALATIEAFALWRDLESPVMVAVVFFGQIFQGTFLALR